MDGGFEVGKALMSGHAHLQELSRRTNIPQTTLRRVLDELLSKKILDYSIKGRNKIFKLTNNLESKFFVQMIENYNRLKLISSYPDLSIIFEDILDNIDCPLIILFGSYAKFRAKKDSDIDIYLETRSKAEKQKIESINSRINAKIGCFDPNNNLIKEIIKNHIIIRGVELFYEKNKLFM